MGYDATCTLRLEGRTLKGTAWLEHKDLVFRGPERVVIPLASVKTATAKGGTLRVQFGSRRAEFEIGDAAVKWAKRIANPPSRLDKLGVKADMTVALVAFEDSDFVAELRTRGAQVLQSPPVSRLRDLDMVFFGAASTPELSRLAVLREAILPDGALWVIRPKGQKTITESDTMAAGKRAGLVDVKVVSFSDVLTAEKFVVPVAARRRRR